MKRWSLPLLALVLLGEVLFLRLAPDASPVLSLPLHALTVGAAGLLAPRAGPGRRRLCVAVLFAGAALGFFELFLAARSPRAPAGEASRQAAVERDADAAGAAFTAAFSEEKSLALALPPELLHDGLSRQELFSRLADFRRTRGRGRERIAITIYGPAGEALAWVGETSVLKEGFERAAPPSDLAQFVRKDSLGTTLFTLRRDGPGAARIAAAERTLDSPSDPSAWRRLLRLHGGLRSELGAEFLDPGEADAAFQEFLARGGDRYWKRGSGSSGGQLLAALRNDRKDLLGVMMLAPESAVSRAAREARFRDLPRQIVLLATVLSSLLFALLVARGSGLALPDLAALASLLVALRLGLFNLASLLGETPLLDYRVFSAPLPLALAASPADCLLSCLTVLGLAAIAAIAIRKGGRLAALSGTVATLATGALLLLVTRSWVNDSSLNPAHVPVLPPEAPHVALGWAHAALAFSAALLAVASLSPRSRHVPIKALGAALLAAGGLSHLALIREAAKVPSTLIESSLMPEVLRADAEARERVSDFLRDAAVDPRWQMVGYGTETALERLAFDAWRESDLGRVGARSAVAVRSVEGRILSSFAYGLPESVFEDTTPRPSPPLADAREDGPPLSGAREDSPPPAGGRGDTPPPAGGRLDDAPVISETSLSVLSLRIPLLRGEEILYRNQAPIGRLEVLLSTEKDNLPFLTQGDPLLKTLGTRGAVRVYDEYLGGSPLFVAYSRSGEVLFPSAEQAAPLAPSLLPAASPEWTFTRFAGTDYRTYLFPTPDGPRAIGYAAPSRISLLAGLLRAMIVLLPLLGVILVIGLLLRAESLWTRLSPTRWARTLSTSYSRRLQAVVLASSLLPLILLAVIFRNTIERRTREGVAQAGVQSAATIRRLLEDYVESGAGGSGGVPISSRTLFWIARTVHQDIHLFVGEELVATSRGDPEASGLPSFRLDDEVARTLALSRPPQILSEEPLPGGRTALVYAPVMLRTGAPEGILAVPLVVQERDLTRGSEAVADALLVATFGLGMLLAGVGYLFARRLSIPIKDLARASQTIARGQLTVRVQARGRDEIRQLIDAFNSMAAALGDQREDLRRRKDYIEAILLNVTTGVISTDPHGVVRTSNPAASLLLDLPIDLVGMNLFAELRRRQELLNVLDLWSADGPGACVGTPREISIMRADGEVRLRSVVIPFAESAGTPPGSIYLVEDVTEVMRSNRLAAWAEMARRIAHEIKNPLTPIQLSAEHLLRVRNDGGEDYGKVLEGCVRTILGQVRALREIASEFSTYARLPDLQREPADLGTLVRATIAPYRANPPAQVRIEEKIEPLPPVSIDARVLRGALVNLVENALQAMDGGGALTVSVRLGDPAASGVAEIVLEDTGDGMDEPTLARIFEPYFSTRDGGTGLGLAIAKRAVEEHGGTITVESSPGRGTRMILRLPLSAAAKSEAGARSPAPSSPGTDEEPAS